MSTGCRTECYNTFSKISGQSQHLFNLHAMENELSSSFNTCSVLSKLQAETDMGSGYAKRATVETHRGETYQFCYFLRKTQPHSITRSFATAPPRNQTVMPPPPVPPKRKPKVPIQPSESRKRRRRIQDNSSDESGGEAELGSSSYRSTRTRKIARANAEVDDNVEDDGDVEMGDDFNCEEEVDAPRESRIKTVQFTLIPDDEEEKPKPILKLKYRGFNIFGHCLCIVVEPWPLIRAPSRAPSIFRSTPVPPKERGSSIAPPDFVASVEARQRARSKTPLFLPDFDEEREREETPFPGQTQEMFVMDDDDEYGGMMQFSQVLHSAGDNRAGAADDDEDMEGAVLFGDADENREL
ncbi:hypothetical protein WG66_012204 [Moniliophthora roreri]|nr:hypothetical protein WG66_012204 [Moniliophthora roreri]